MANEMQYSIEPDQRMKKKKGRQPVGEHLESKDNI